MNESPVHYTEWPRLLDSLEMVNLTNDRYILLSSGY